LCPTGIISGTAALCDNITTTPLSIALTGDSPWTITYAIDGVAQPAITGVTTSPYVFQSSTGAHSYTLTSVTTINATTGCSGNISGSAVVSIRPLAPVGHDAVFTPPASVLLTVDNTGGTYNWYDAAVGGSLVFTGTTYNTPVLNNTTSYYVEQVVASQTSCSRTLVTATAVSPTVPLFFPNLITPNGDGSNDAFVIQGLPSNSSVSVYNNWGNRVFDSDAYQNDWVPNKESDGMYYYEVVLPDGKEYKSWLHIVR